MEIGERKGDCYRVLKISLSENGELIALYMYESFLNKIMFADSSGSKSIFVSNGKDIPARATVYAPACL